MPTLESLFLKHQKECVRLNDHQSKREVRSSFRSRKKIKDLRNQCLSMCPGAIQIRDLIHLCSNVDDYLLLTFLFQKMGFKSHCEIVYSTLLSKLSRTQELIKVGRQMISYGYSGGYDFISKANSCVTNVYERILVQETIDRYDMASG